MTNYSHLSTTLWDMWMTKYRLSLGYHGDQLFLKQRNQLDGIWLRVQANAIPAEEIHPFDYLVALAETLTWSADANRVMAEYVGASAITDLLKLVEQLHNTELE